MCPDCGIPLPQDMVFCPHCGRPGNFPNVRAAQAEAAALNVAYTSAVADANSKGTASVVGRFEAAVATSVPVRNVGELEFRTLCNPTAMTSTFEKMQGAEIAMKGDDPWTPWRLVAGAALFPGSQQEIRFGAIALPPDMIGVENYGPFTLVLKEDMVAHRTSVFVTNSGRIVKNNGMAPGGKIAPEGNRATWDDRAKLAVAKLAPSLNASTPDQDFARILLTPGATSGDDEFVEIHIFRPLTIRSVAAVVVRRNIFKGRGKRRLMSATLLLAAKVGLKAAGIPLREV